MSRSSRNCCSSSWKSTNVISVLLSNPDWLNTLLTRSAILSSATFSFANSIKELHESRKKVNFQTCMANREATLLSVYRQFFLLRCVNPAVRPLVRCYLNRLSRRVASWVDYNRILNYGAKSVSAGRRRHIAERVDMYSWRILTPYRDHRPDFDSQFSRVATRDIVHP